jgi:ribulose bisphosphate carboxylase small subunit
MKIETTSSYKIARQLVRKGYKIGVNLCFGNATVWLQKTDWIRQTKSRDFLTNYNGEHQDFYIDHDNKYIEFCGSTM